MIGVRYVYGVMFVFVDVGRKGFAVVFLFGIIRAAEEFDEIHKPRVGTGRVIWWIGKSEDVFVFAYGKTFDLTKFRIFEFYRQFFQKIFTSVGIGGEGPAKALYRTRRDGGGRQANIHLFGLWVVTMFCHK
jgi:hypothetical protein